VTLRERIIPSFAAFLIGSLSLAPACVPGGLIADDQQAADDADEVDAPDAGVDDGVSPDHWPYPWPCPHWLCDPGPTDMGGFAERSDGGVETGEVSAAPAKISSDPNILPLHSCDAMRIAFTSQRGNGDTEVYLVSGDGGALVNLSQSPETDDWEPQWSPDGQRLVWTRDYAIWVMYADGTGQHQLANATGTLPRWAPVGTKVAYIEPNVGLRVVDTSDPTLPTVLIPGTVTRFDWSPDGTRLAFVRVNGAHSDMWTVLKNGTGLKQLTHSALVDEDWPSWSPNGGAIAYTRRGATKEDVSQVCIMTAKGTSQHALTAPQLALDESQPQWFPGGARLAFLRGDQIRTINVDGTDDQELATSGTQPQDLSISRNGQRLAWVADYGDNVELFAMDADGADAVQVTDDPPFGAPDTAPVWQPCW